MEIFCDACAGVWERVCRCFVELSTATPFTQGFAICWHTSPSCSLIWSGWVHGPYSSFLLASNLQFPSRGTKFTLQVLPFLIYIRASFSGPRSLPLSSVCIVSRTEQYAIWVEVYGILCVLYHSSARRCPLALLGTIWSLYIQLVNQCLPPHIIPMNPFVLSRCHNLQMPIAWNNKICMSRKLAHYFEGHLCTVDWLYKQVFWTRIFRQCL